MTETVGATPRNDSPFDPRDFRNALGLFPTGVTIITTRATDGDDVGMTMNSFNTVSLDPPLVLFCVDKHAYSLPAWQAAGAYGVSVLSEGQDPLSNKFAKALEDKWDDVKIRRGIGDVPLIEGASAHFECEPYAQHEGGDHIIFVVRVQRYQINAKPGSLAFCHGRYNHLKPGSVAPPDWPLPIHY